MEGIASLIAGQRPVPEILEALCRHAACSCSGGQAVFYVVDNDDWLLDGPDDLHPDCAAQLASADPAALSGALLEAELDQAGGMPFADGWVRHLHSANGELLGLFVSLARGPMSPIALHRERISTVCRLAELAIEQRHLLDELAFKADHDPLTKLANRSCYERMMKRCLADSRIYGRQPALLLLNLDRFRLVNDVLGHAVGNLLLTYVAHRFRSCVQGYEATLARIGGDDFAVLLEDAPGHDAEVLARRLLDSLSRSFAVERNELFASASIGIARAGSATTPEILEREAALALSYAKRGGTVRWMVYDARMAATPPERLEMERRLRFALAKNELVVYFQPQVSLETRGVIGAEALLRWRPEQLGIVSPGVFIPILEETGMIVDVGRWVIQEVCRQGREWLDRGQRVRIAVNVSATQFADPGFLDDVKNALETSGYPPELLELELTESLFVGDFPSARAIFERLQGAGVTLIVDDFGTGQCSLLYLQELPFQRLKVDQSFVRRLMPGTPVSPLVDNILKLARSLGMATVGEGIETAYQADILQSLGCEEGQGFLFAPALPAADFAAYSESRARSTVA